MDDDVELYVEVTRPDPAVYPDLDVPAILEASPYHGTLANREGTSLLPEPVDERGRPIGLTRYFAPRGYAVVMVDLRGTGHSGGCLDHLGPRDAADLRRIVEWAASQDWSSGRVGIIGHSYPGFAAARAVAEAPAGLATAVVIAGGASMYDHQFQYGVPYFLQYAGPIAAYPALTVARYGPIFSGDLSEQHRYAACGAFTSAALAGTGQVTGQYEGWHRERDYREEAVAADVPLFVVHGVDDAQVRMPAGEWFFARRLGRAGDKVWLGPWGHEAGSHARPTQWQHALHAWFDRNLLGVDVDTGPAVEVWFDTGRVTTAARWTSPPATVALHPDAASMALAFEPPTVTATATFTARGNVDGPERIIHPLLDLMHVPRYDHDDGGVEFRSAPLAQDLVVLGPSRLRLRASVSGGLVHLVATLWRENGDGRRLLDACAIQPQLREGVDTVTPVVPGAVMDLAPQCFTTAHHLREGDRLVLRVGTGSEHHFAPFSADARVSVVTGPGATRYELGIRSDAPLYADVDGAGGGE